MEQYKVPAEEKVSKGGKGRHSKNPWHGKEQKGQRIDIAETGLLGNGGRWEKSHKTSHRRIHKELTKGLPGTVRTSAYRSNKKQAAVGANF